MVIHFGFSTKIVDVETAFLYEDLEEEIHMECPHGGCGKNDCIILTICIYDLVQRARQWYKKAVKILKKSGDNVDPCLYVKKSERGIVYATLCR